MTLSPPMVRLIEALARRDAADYLTELAEANQQLAEQRPNPGELHPVDQAA